MNHYPVFNQFSQKLRENLSVFLLTSLPILVIGYTELQRAVEPKPAIPEETYLETDVFPRILRDSLGKTVIIPEKPQRIISQTLATDEILLALCPLERIVTFSALATDDYYSHIVEQAKSLKKQQTNHNVESILSLNPDLVLISSYNRAEMINLLQATGLSVFRFNHFYSINDIKNNIRRIGYAIGEDESARLLIIQMEQEIAAIRQQIPKNIPSPRVLFYDSFGYTAGRHTFFDDMVLLVAGINLASEHEIEGYVKLNSELIYDWQPYFIVTSAIQGQFEQTRQHLLKNPLIATSNAGKTGRIILIDHRDFNATSHHIVPAIEALAKGLYETTHP
jgi:iron complex transport system substrate-binding protein